MSLKTSIKQHIIRLDCYRGFESHPFRHIFNDLHIFPLYNKSGIYVFYLTNT